jgi:threonine dehydratase
MISREHVAAAWSRIRPHVRRTPALGLTTGALGLAMPVALKLESLQVSGSFKGRGAFHKLLVSKVPPAGVIAASGGNHGAAVAYAARARPSRRDLRADDQRAHQGGAAAPLWRDREPGRRRL